MNIIFNDFTLDDDEDLMVSGGDFAVGPSDKRHITDIILSYPGEWKQYPNVGVGIQSYLNSDGRQQEIARNVRVQLEADGYTVNVPDVVATNPQVIINPNAYRQ